MMKKILTLVFVAAAFVANAQSIRVLHGGAMMNDNDTVTVYLDGQSEEVDTYFGYQNMTSNSLNFRVRKEIISMNEETTEILFCVGDCYTGNLSSVLTLAANEMISEESHNAFHSSYMGGTDAALVKYTFFLTDNESDKISFYIRYTSGVGVRPVDMAKALNAYPNPATSMVNIEYAAPDNASLVIKNLTGKEVYRTDISQTGRKRVDVSKLNPGMYLYGVEVEGKMLCTKKLLVK